MLVVKTNIYLSLILVEENVFTDLFVLLVDIVDPSVKPVDKFGKFISGAIDATPIVPSP